MNSRFPWQPLVSMLAAVVYGASPLDVLPDLIPMLGLVDDALIVPLLLLWSAWQFGHWRGQRRKMAISKN